MNKQVDLTFLSNYTIFATILIIAIISIGAIIYSILQKKTWKHTTWIKRSLINSNHFKPMYSYIKWASK